MPKGRSTEADQAVDKAVGARIRALRLAAGMSQVALGSAAGVTFQQLQKYERGHNRVAASRLAALAKALHVPIVRLLEDAPPGANAEQLEAWAVAFEPDAVGLIRDYVKCSVSAQRAIRDLTRVWAEETASASAASSAKRA